jgi:hypothetical protein
MSFVIGAAHAPAVEALGWSTADFNVLRDRDINSLRVLAPRNETAMSSDTVNLFIDAIDENFGYAASIVEACVEQTVYALQCTSGNVGSATCGPNGAVSFPVFFLCCSNAIADKLNPDSYSHSRSIHVRFLQCV